MEKTKEYREGYYYDEKKMYAAPSRVPLSPFWADFARHLRSGSAAPFMSQHFVYCTHSLSEVIFCVSVLDVAAAAPRCASATRRSASAWRRSSRCSCSTSC